MKRKGSNKEIRRQTVPSNWLTGRETAHHSLVPGRDWRTKQEKRTPGPEKTRPGFDAKSMLLTPNVISE